MKCPKCNTEIKDAFWGVHQRMCPEAGVVGREQQALPPNKLEPATPVPAEKPANVNGQYEVFTPQPDPHFLVQQDIAEELAIIEKLSAKHPVNLLVTGQPGGGKTSLALQFAAKYNRPCVVVDFGVLQEPQELFHTTRLETSGNGSRTDIRESGFVRGLETPRCVVVLDELNRPENERVLNVLMPLLDGRRMSYIDYLRRRVTVADGVVFIATLNEGAAFCGVSSIDLALRDRFREIHLPYLPMEQEAIILKLKTGIILGQADILATFAHKIRQAPSITPKVSTRQLLTAAESIAIGDEFWRAVSTAIGHYNDLSWRQAVMEVFSFCLQDTVETKKWRDARNREGTYVRLH